MATLPVSWIILSSCFYKVWDNGKSGSYNWHGRKKNWHRAGLDRVIIFETKALANKWDFYDRSQVFSNLKHIYLKFPCLPKKNEKLRNEAKSAY